jgi:DNA-binding GntR family transcriptional regulator
VRATKTSTHSHGEADQRNAAKRHGANGARATRADEVYHRLRSDILEINLQPGDQLDEDQLAATYGVSRTPVREALRRLASDGLVTLRPRRGASVAQISIREIWEIEQICELVEPLAARLAAGHMSREQLDDLGARLDACATDNPSPDDFTRYMKLDVELHAAILEASGNGTMRDIVTHLHRRMNAVRLIANRHRYDQSLAEHRRIIAALLAGDGDGAADAMRHHIQQRALRQRMGLLGLDDPVRVDG